MCLSGLGSAVPGPATVLAQAGDPVLVGAGDITSCGQDRDEATAQLLDGIASTVFTLGDNAYPDGTLAEFTDCYGPTWGRHKDRTRPSPGNHDYHTAGAAGYYTYFGTAASPRETNCTSDCQGYYSYDLGAWHIIVLNSEIERGAGSAQEQWLRADLAANQRTCTLAYWHKPRFSSGQHGNATSVQAFWQALYEYGADVVLNGHDHTYERFAPQNPDGQADPTRGIREFVVGTGGASLYSFPAIQANSEVRDNTTWGVLKLTLHATSYDWQFVPIAGQTFSDAGSANCVGAGPGPIPTPTDTPPPGPTATPTATPAPTDSPTPTPTDSPTPPPGSGDNIFVSSTSSGAAGGIPFADEDVLIYDTNTGAWALYFDGSDVLPTAVDVDAFSRLSDGSFLLSLDAAANVGALGLVDDSDVVRFTPSSVGPDTAGTFAWYFDASDVDLLDDGEDLDAVTPLSDGRLVVSTMANARVTGVSGRDEDLLVFTPAQPSGVGDDTTSGAWAVYFDGSDVRLTRSSEDIKGVWVDPANGKIYLTTTDAFAVAGVSGDGADIFVCAPGSTGQKTSCTFQMYWDGSAHGFAGEVIDVVEIDKGAQQVTSDMLAALRATEHNGAGDDPLADPDEGPDEGAEPLQEHRLSLPLMRR
ncbi:MAG TPA: metallophosphoesterase [Candidatus Tectomicrobia bacterium]